MSSLSNDSSQSKSSESSAAPKPSAPELVHTESNSSLLIPDSSSRDGFYGYTDEKSLQHMEEKYWAHRRASDVSNAHSDTAASAGASSAPMSSLAPNLSYVSPAATFVSPATTTLPAIHEPDNGNSPFIESDDEGEDGDASKGRKVQVQVQAPAQPQSAIPLPLPPNFTSAPTTADPLPQPELAPLFQSLDRCLALRDKYMARSLQRLGDNPRDHDGVFPPRSGIPRSVSGADEGEADEKSDPPHHHQPWKIYPPPPPPHWHVTDKPQPASHAAGESKAGEGNGFEFGQCEIPGRHPWVFEMDEQGVYQVYADESDDTDTLANGDVFGEGQGGGGSNELDKVNAKGKIKSIEVAKISGTEASRPLTTTRKPLFPPPTIREYFRDLDALLTFIADGPAKSFAYRRLRYLAGKFEMYYLVNEGRELVCMKRPT
ncbi:hypothetical protein BJ138DRAFT_1129705 [Hygrophoropsis aurantiaca]|uniref:Uncharacterized protein n=1 Tax=Hygrophoropsis aurantiaca TaxID=72124 RepID=A0ACB8A0Z2_9AGAM|nr:hypothetical protein BJ138DRAFT_1129705 [Hygrophoropsis aurantiaca]